MFTEAQSQRSKAARRLEDLARTHPTGFTVVLSLLTAIVVVTLLFQTGYSFVLYQGF